MTTPVSVLLLANGRRAAPTPKNRSETDLMAQSASPNASISKVYWRRCHGRFEIYAPDRAKALPGALILLGILNRKDGLWDYPPGSSEELEEVRGAILKGVSCGEVLVLKH